ncbi:MAG: hypothetical protein ACYS9X_09485 [Planctomycetota bacterium]|jgi:chromosome segregation ATPase
MDGLPNEPEPRRAGPLGVMAVSAVVLCAAGALLVFSWIRQSRLEGELTRARTLLEEARARLGPRAAEPVDPDGAADGTAGVLEMLERERGEIARLEKERAELERRSKERALETAALERRIKRLREEVDRLTRDRLSGRSPGSAPDRQTANASEADDIFKEHMRLMQETRELRDRLKVMIDAFEDLMLEKAADASRPEAPRADGAR